MKLFTCFIGYTLRNKGSNKILPEELRFYPEQFASEEPFFEKRVSHVCKTMGSIKNLFHQFLQETVLQRLLKSLKNSGSLHHDITGFSVEPPWWVLEKTLGM